MALRSLKGLTKVLKLMNPPDSVYYTQILCICILNMCVHYGRHVSKTGFDSRKPLLPPHPEHIFTAWGNG